MGELSTAQIIQACDDSMIIFDQKDYYAYMGFSMMYNRGLRYIEIFEVSRWTIKNSNFYYFQPAKGGNRLTLPASVVPAEYKTYILNSKPTFASLRKDTALRLFKRYFPIQNIFHLTHPVKTHIYRYSKCKEMYLNGYTYQEIADYLGEVEVVNIQNYVNATLYTP